MASLLLLLLFTFRLSYCEVLNNNDINPEVQLQQEQNKQLIQEIDSNPQEANDIDTNNIHKDDLIENVPNKEDAAVNIDENSKKEEQVLPHKHTTKTKEESTTHSSYAWVSMIDTNVTNIIAARVLSQSLSKHNSQAARILICAPGISDKARNMLRDFGWKIYVIDVNMFAKIKSYPDEIKRELLQILMFNFTQYSSVGYLSPQSMVTTNIDHLFTCGENAFCGATNDKHYQIYEKHQMHTKKLLSTHDSVFDDNIFLMTPETDLYLDMFSFISSSTAHNGYFTSYLSEYFYHYCKGSGYPISHQEGEYKAPRVSFNCSVIPNSMNSCTINKEISKSACYILEEGYNFHPSHNDHISSSWRWKQSMKHLSIKIIQYSSYNMLDADHNAYKPWKWRYVLFSGWMIEWSTFADIEPNVYYEFLLKNDAHHEVMNALWQKPILYLFFVVIFLSTLTALCAPLFNVLSFIIHRVSGLWPSAVIAFIHVYKWCICPLLMIWSVFIIIKPIKNIFIDGDIIPELYPFKRGWLLALQYCYFTSCFEFIIMCFVMLWSGNLYHPMRFRIKWFDYLQLKLFVLQFRALTRKKMNYYHDIESGVMRYNKSINTRRDTASNCFMRIILKCQNYNAFMQRMVIKYCSVLVVIALKWCLSYLGCIVVVLWTIWILRFNDWHELKLIVATECIISIIWLIYCSLRVYCQFFIFPQTKKFGEKYFDPHAFQKGI